MQWQEKCNFYQIVLVNAMAFKKNSIKKKVLSFQIFVATPNTKILNRFKLFD